MSTYTEAEAAIELMRERWPKCFSLFQDPLAFRLYVNNPGYLNAMRLGVARVDLNGEVAGTVDENDAKSAQARLNGNRKFKKDRKQRRREEVAQAAPPPASAPLPPSPTPPPTPPSRDSFGTLCEAARQHRGAA